MAFIPANIGIKINSMKSRLLLVVCLVTISNLAFWLYGNQPITPSQSSFPFQSISFNPYQRSDDPLEKEMPSVSEIEADIERLKSKTLFLRTYSTEGTLASIPEIASKHNLKVILSAWIENNRERNKEEVERAIKIAGLNKNVTRLIIGNETQLTKTIPQSELIGYLQEARKRLHTPVSTAEPWDFWINNPDFVQHVDFIAIHVLPYWNEVPIEEAVDYVVGKYNAVRNAFPGRVVLLAETGWPSNGPQVGAAQASLSNQATFVREFLYRVKSERIRYNIIEAFDQPWKKQIEGLAGAHWGIFDADRNPKFPIQGPVLDDPNWKWWALSSSVIGFFATMLILFRKRDLRLRGQIFTTLITQGVVAVVVLFAREAGDQYILPSDIAFWTILILAQTLLAIIFFTDNAEVADVIGHRPLKRKFLPSPNLNRSACPMVSIHLACCNEPPEMVIATIDSLSRLDYPFFEVIVVDNNTPDPATWAPVEARCKELGESFRFYSLGKWPGFKAGALNFALAQTDFRSTVVGVVDADYVVEPNWLSSTIPYFDSPKVSLVQAPQEHRSFENSSYLTMENDEYTGFFRVGMVQRNEDNAIIQHGTMTLVRREMLSNLGGWAEWCICEDAELGLRLLLEGKESIYIDHAFGRGLVPDSFEAYAKQRFRWAYGAMRILKRYWKELLGLKGQLSPAQRYQFVKGWLPWIGDGLHFFFTLAALLWSAQLIIDPYRTAFPAEIFVYPALALVFSRMLGTALVYATRVKIGPKRTILAMIAGTSLTHRIAMAVLQGLSTKGKPFYRTPKMATQMRLLKSLLSVYQELILGSALIASSLLIIWQFDVVNDEAVLWAIALVIQGIPYYAAVCTSLISGQKRKVFKNPEAVLLPVKHPLEQPLAS